MSSGFEVFQRDELERSGAPVIGVLRHGELARRMDCDMILMVGVNRTSPTTTRSFLFGMGSEELQPRAIAAGFRLAIEEGCFGQILGVMLHEHETETLQAIARALDFHSRREVEHGGAQEGPGPDAGGEAEPGPGGARAPDDAQEPPKEDVG